VNAGGKNIYPGPIEELFKTSRWIEYVLVVGENQDYMAALIAPDFDTLELWADEQKISYDSGEKLIQTKKVQKLYKDEVEKYSKRLASHEKIRDFRLLPDEFTIGTGELTPSLKVKRRVVEAKYQNVIADIFS
jgi:long-chain acyl-CoA synthetase